MFFVELCFSSCQNYDIHSTSLKALLWSHVELSENYIKEIHQSLSASSLMEVITSGDAVYLSNYEFCDVPHELSFRVLFNVPWSINTSGSPSESEILSIIRTHSPIRRSYSSIQSISACFYEKPGSSFTRLSSVTLAPNPSLPCDSSTYYDSQSRLSIYGFENKLDIDRPPYLMFDYTNICNAKCIHCPQSVGFEGQGDKGNLSIETIKAVLDSVYQTPPEIIRITGDGEPLMNPIFFPSLELISSYGFNTLTAITTNGSLLTQKSIQQLISFNPMLIDVSLDAFSKEVYSKVRVGLSFDTVMRNVLNLISAQIQRPELFQFGNRSNLFDVVARSVQAIEGLAILDAGKRVDLVVFKVEVLQLF